MVVLNVLPLPGPIGATQALSFDVQTIDLAPYQFVSIIVTIFYAGAQMQEVVYANNPLYSTAFVPVFAGSTVTPVTDVGFQHWHFNIVRNAQPGQPMWPGSPQLIIYAFDSSGTQL